MRFFKKKSKEKRNLVWREKILNKPRRRSGVWYAKKEEEREQEIGLWQEEREKKISKIIDTNLR